jgi:hypothetical protein
MNNKYAMGMEAAFDRITAERDAALAQESMLARDAANWKRKACESADRERELQQRLTAADGRANVLEGLLAKYYNRSDVCAFMAKDIGAALKPAEPATDGHVCNGCGEKGWTANCKECVPY